jgi:hypothetical protein
VHLDDRIRAAGRAVTLQSSNDMTNNSAHPRRFRTFAIAALLLVIVTSVIAFALERRRHTWFNGVDIRGSAAFRDRTIDAMKLLQTKSPSDFDEVCAIVTQIREDDRSGTDVERARVSIAKPSSMNVSLAWYASVLVHETHHARLYKTEHKHRDGDAVFAAEIECINIQLAALKRVGGDEREIAWLTSKVDGHHPDVDHDGRYTWDDYYKRDW